MSLSESQARTLHRECAWLSPNVVSVYHGNGKLLDFYSRDANEAFVPERMYPDVRKFLVGLLTPRAEKDVMVHAGKNHRSDEDTHDGFEARDWASTGGVVLFGAPDLLSLANHVSAVRPKIKKEPQKGFTINVGIGTDGSNILPTLPSYIELGLQRHLELLSEGFASRLRFFSMGSVSARFGMIAKSRVEDVQEEQRNLIEAYLTHFYPDIYREGTVDLSDLQKEIPEPSEVLRNAILEKIRDTTSERITKALKAFSSRYTGSKDNGLLYAMYHCLPQTFGDPAPDAEGDPDGPINISVGGSGEYVFNSSRFFSPYSSTGFGRLGIVVNGICCRTPPYLRRTNRSAPFELDMPTFLRLPVTQILKHRRPERVELAHMVRCLKQSPDRSDQNSLEIVGSLKALYKSL